jgi:hypothetical protein
MGPPIRSAEKARVSSCQVADEVAEAVIAKFKSIHCEPVSSQIVLAGIVAILDSSAVRVVSLAIGNKFEASGTKRTDCVRDCHAEILARRAFKRFLLDQFDLLSSGNDSALFTLARDNRIIQTPNVQWALYVSSCPCGNACIRRWGDSPKEKFDDTVKEFQLPQNAVHAPFLAHARHEGQTAVSFKGESSILSCSDKILKWSINGLQGAGLSGMTESAIYLDAIVIGRKFVRKHAERAFCCRLTSKKISKNVATKVHHPTMLCTARKLDDGPIDAVTGAVFTDSVMWWCLGRDVEYIDGSSGKRVDGSRSLLGPEFLRCSIPPPLEAVAVNKLLETEMFNSL